MAIWAAEANLSLQQVCAFPAKREADLLALLFEPAFCP
jgi:hypothetical protein